MREEGEEREVDDEGRRRRLEVQCFRIFFLFFDSPAPRVCSLNN